MMVCSHTPAQQLLPSRGGFGARPRTEVGTYMCIRELENDPAVSAAGMEEHLVRAVCMKGGAMGLLCCTAAPKTPHAMLTSGTQPAHQIDATSRGVSEGRFL